MILVLILTQNVSFSQEEGFPGVPYKRVVAYMLNTKKSTAKPDQFIWHQDNFAFSKIGDGVELNEKQVESLSKITVQDMSTLQTGLSKCFIPRHGLIYFNEKNKPVASLSICFECQKIDAYPNNMEETKKFDSKKALKQLDGLEKIIKDLGFVKYDKPWEYEKEHEKAQYSNEGEITITEENYAHRLLKNPPYDFEVKPKVKITRTSRVIERKKERKNKDGTITSIKEHTFYSSRLEYVMGEKEWELDFLFVQDPGFVFDNEVQIGMSQDDFIATLGVYDGKPNPEKIIVTDAAKNREFTFLFEERTLKRVEGRIKKWND